MNLLTKLFHYLQKFADRVDNRGLVCYDSQVTQFNSAQLERIPVYMSNKPKLYDWEREEAMLRHPSNYKRNEKRSK